MYLQYEHNKPLIKTFVAGHSFSLSLRVQYGMTAQQGDCGDSASRIGACVVTEDYD